MAIFNPSFILAVIVILYISSLVLFAIIRIATGISIQRLGYFSLRRISYTIKDGIRIDIRGLGLHLHRPTFAQPTWISLRLTEVKLTIDPEHITSERSAEQGDEATKGKVRLWGQLMRVKNHLKAIHNRIQWLRLVDVEILNSHLIITRLASLQVASITMAVDTRRKTVDRGRLFRHKKSARDDQQPAEWMVVIKSILFTAEGKDSLEVLDLCALNVHGLLYKHIAGLRDASISLKLGRMHIPYDDILHCQRSLMEQIKDTVYNTADGHHHDTLIQKISEARELVSSVLRGIQEIQVAISFIGLAKRVTVLKSTDKPLYLNFAMNEFGVDLFRLDQKGPAHRMYFNPLDTAHQALLAAISISVSIDDGSNKPGRLIYIPMATATIKTTLPSKTISSSIEPNLAERNANILFANLVITSPSLDIDLKRLSLVLALVFDKAGNPKEKSQSSISRTLRQLLPRASIKLSIQEPVARVSLPAFRKAAREAGDYDLLISSTSSISLDLESVHSSTTDKDYSLVSNFRIASHQFYYQTALLETINLVVLETFDLKTNVTIAPKLKVEVLGHMDTFSVHMVRSEISEGLHQISHQLRRNRSSRADGVANAKNVNFLRRVPTWLQQFQLKGSSFSIEVAGVDPKLSKDCRGVALQLESWSVEYRLSHKGHSRQPSSISPKINSLASKDEVLTDGRKLVIHALATQAFVVEGLDTWEPAAFLSIPKLEVSGATVRDHRGPILHISSHIKTVMMQYSLYRYYALLLSYGVIRRAFGHKQGKPESSNSKPSADIPTTNTEITTFDLKSPLIQIKASLPHDPAVMLHVFNLEAGYNRWTSPYVKSRFIRLYVETPKIKTVWVRLISIKTIRLDMRLSRRKMGKEFIAESSFDLSSDFIRMGVPHQVVVHKIIDNIINTLKATEQLNYRAKTGEDDCVLRKPPQEAKLIPKISLRSKYLMFELEDSSFEWKLGLIYRLGLVEQKQRLARNEAFCIKVKKMEEQQHVRRDSSRNIPSLTKSRGRHRQHGSISVKHEENKVRASSGSPATRSDRPVRYDTEGTSELSGSARISADEAWKKLQQHNATSWKRRINSAAKYQAAALKDTRHMFWGNDEVPDNFEDTETILALPSRPGLLTALINDLHITIEKPTFPIGDLPQFLHKVGKGIPLDMSYSLLIPMHLQINMGETRLTLRNYPLPLIHVPALRSEQSTRVPSWSVKTNFVIAEEFRNDESMREISVPIIAAKKLDPTLAHKGGFSMQVRRTASPVKTFSDVDIAINSALPTTMTWGTSYQPAIQEMMQIIESFTKPQVDPSERVGFWDKIRLIFHSRVRIAWEGDGDLHLRLKGSRDPYAVTGYGAGFVMCYRNKVRWDIHQEDDPKKFMTVSCGEYVLAIPDYSHQALQSHKEAAQDDESVSSRSTSNHQNAHFKKVIMKLSGNVRWLAGLVFERNGQDGGRSFEFVPHYNVTLKNPNVPKVRKDLPYDAFRGFRSHHIHVSIAVIAPVDRDWSVTNTKPSLGYNSMHLSPKFFTHFFDWWSLFSGVMSLPIRQGKLFPGSERSNKKFGRHIATIKYNLLLSPFFIAHVYKHKDIEDYTADAVGATGLKLRIDSFMLDVHQRREEFNLPSKGRLKGTKTSGMRINKAQLDFISADVRAVSASIKGTSTEELQRATDDELSSFHDQAFVSPDVSRFTIPDNDTLWIDMDDFVELDWILPSETNPETMIMPLAFAPRFTYFRQTDHISTKTPGTERRSAFGDEPTHFCVMTEDNDPSRVQHDLVLSRLKVLQEQLDKYRVTVNEYETKLMLTEDNKQHHIKEQYEHSKQQCEVIGQMIAFMASMLQKISQHLSDRYGGQTSNTSNGNDEDEDSTNRSRRQHSSFEELGSVSDFSNRFIVHNIQLKWNNSLRNIILRYAHQVSQRRGFVYYMSRKAVKFLLDILEEQKRSRSLVRAESKSHTPSGTSSPSASFKDPFREENKDLRLEDRISELLKDGKNFVDADDSDHDMKGPVHPSGNERAARLSGDFVALNTYHVRLVAPQIQLQSEKNAKSILLVTAREMQLKVVQIMDKDRLHDDVSGLVQRRFSADMDGVQFFVTSQKILARFLKFYGANNYGAPKGSCWPPWAPIEVNFDYQLNPSGWCRVIGKTSASLRYDKYNTLRLKYNDEVSKGDSCRSTDIDDPESRIDKLWVEFPHIRARCDSKQYYTMYVIVLDLLLYSEPLEKARSEKLEKMLLATDFTNLSGVPEMVTRLQDRIHQLEEIKLYFQLHAKSLDRHGWSDRLMLEKDLANCENELFIVMKAITTSQRKYDDRSPDSQTNGLLRWYLSASEIVWHLMRDNDQPLLKIQLQHATYERTDNSDGSNLNTMEIERIHGSNLLPDAIYPQMIAPYFDKETTKSSTESESIKMFKVQWHMLEAIAGIPVLDQFEVNLYPLKIQLEREIGKKVFEYIFPEGGKRGKDVEASSQLQNSTNEERDDTSDDGDDGYTVLSDTMEVDESDSRSGSLDMRLRPTLNLHYPSSHNDDTRSKSRASIPHDHRRFKLFSAAPRSKSLTRSTTTFHSSTQRSSSSRRSGESVFTRATPNGSSTNLSSSSADKPSRNKFGLTRTASMDMPKDDVKDEVSQMMERASNYMTLAYAKIPSVVLCLSYKGKGDRNLEDVHDFVFRMPTLEYRNKTWSNLDMALRLKRDVTKALISHTGAIISNKFSHLRPNKHIQSRLRETANSTSLEPNTTNFDKTFSENLATTRNHRGQSRERDTVPSSSGFIAGWGQNATSQADTTSLNGSMISPSNNTGFSANNGLSNIKRLISPPTRNGTSRPPSSTDSSSDRSYQEDEEDEEPDHLEMRPHSRERTPTLSSPNPPTRSLTLTPKSKSDLSDSASTTEQRYAHMF